MATLVLTVIGDDRSGLVEALARVVAEHGGNWNRSSMARLGTKFAGIVEVGVPADRVDELVDGLAPVREHDGLEVSVERVDEDPSAAPAADGERRQWELHLVGQDRPGIVHEIAHALADHGVGIEQLETFSTSAPMSAEVLFEANALLVGTVDTDVDALRSALEALANELMVDVEFTV